MKKNCKGWNQHQNGIFLFCRVKPSVVDNLFIRLNGKTWLEAKNWLTLSSWRHRRINAFSKLYNSQHWALTFFWGYIQWWWLVLLYLLGDISAFMSFQTPKLYNIRKFWLWNLYLLDLSMGYIHWRVFELFWYSHWHHE